ncbi:MAG: hemerythrin domain-containing protein [Pseudomonadota bacterium]
MTGIANWNEAVGTDTPSLKRVAADGQRVSDLCDLLEAMADDLPKVAPAVWKEARRLSLTLLPEHLDDMAQVLLPVLARRAGSDLTCAQMLARLQLDYEDGSLHLTELSDMLADGAVSGGRAMSSDALGYALRGFFEPLRRQMDWEKDVLLPLATRCLTADDLTEIARRMGNPSRRARTPIPNVRGSGRA